MDHNDFNSIAKVLETAGQFGEELTEYLDEITEKHGQHEIRLIYKTILESKEICEIDLVLEIMKKRIKGGHLIDDN